MRRRTPSLLAVLLFSTAAIVACGSSSDQGGPAAGGSGGGGTGGIGGSNTGGTAGDGGADARPITVDPDDAVYEKTTASDAPLPGAVDTTPIKYTPSVQGYSLPVDPGAVANLDAGLSSASLYSFDQQARSALTSRGMVALRSTSRIEDFAAAYTLLDYNELPVLVTTDSTLHLYHLFFDQLLKSVETRTFIPMFGAMLPALRDKLASMYLALDGDLKEAARRDLAFVTVVEALLDPTSVVVYDVVADEVAKERAYVGEQSSMNQDPILSHGCWKDTETGCRGEDLSDEEYLEGNACFCEDYTQYKPRGHYTQSPELQRYFQAAMKLGRFPMRIKSPVETTMAALLTAAMNETRVSYGTESVTAAELWSRIYRASSFFAGAADDLTFVDYDRVLRDVYGESFSLSALSDNLRLNQLREKLAEEREPKVTSSFIQTYVDETKATMGLRFLGQRFAFDAYVLGELVFDNVGPNPESPGYPAALQGGGDCGAVGELPAPVCDDESRPAWTPICCAAGALEKADPDVCRLLPTGLDVAAAFGSTRAREHLTAAGHDTYCAYGATLESLKTEVAGFDEADWWKNLYTGWLYLLQPSFEKDYTGFPTWMTGTQYRDKNLNTGLASWAELRHDTILYVKQSYTGGYGGCGGSAVPPKESAYYVEPQPEVYDRLADLLRFTRTGLTSLGLLPGDLEPTFSATEYMFDSLAQISVHELEGHALDPSEQDYVGRMGESMETIIAKLAAADSTQAVEVEDRDGLKTSVIADVHTDGNRGEVLEAGSGAIDWVVVVNRLPDGTLVATIGPIFTYYEFAQPMTNRLTDEQWRAMLGTADEPERPAWVQGIYPAP